MKLYSRDRARRSLFDTIGYRALAQIATVLSYVVLVRSMSEQFFSILMLMYAVIPLLGTVGSLGLDLVFRRFQPEFLRGGQVAESAWLIRIVQRLRFASNILILVAILFAWTWVAPWFGLAAYRADFMIFSVLILLHFQVLILQLSLSSHMQHQFSVGSVALLSATKLAGYSILAALHELTLQNAILTDLAALAVAFGFLLYAQRRVDSQQPRPGIQRPSADERSRIWRYALYSHWNDTASILQYSETDRFFVARLLNPLAVGAYAFYTRLTDMVTSIVPQRLFDNLIQPMFFGVPPHEAREKLPRYFTFLVNMSLVYQLPLLAFTLVYHEDIVQVAFGGKFVEHSYLLPVVIAFSTTDNVFSIPIHLVAQYHERASLILRSQLTGIYQIAAMVVLVPSLGLLGAAIASGTFHILRNLFVWWHVREQGIWTNWRASILSALLVWGSVALMCWQLRVALHLPRLLELCIGAAAYAIAGLLYLRTPAICPSDRAILGNVLHGKESRVLSWLGLLPGSRSP